VEGLKVGHFTNKAEATGVSVFLLDKPGIGSYCICGSAPASLELPVLDLNATVSHLDALVFTGGSALGLGAVAGANKWLKEQGRGWPTEKGCIPIVPAAAIYDLWTGGAYFPSPEAAYEACLSAALDNHAMGRVGAGAGASTGKLIPGATSSKGGLGFASAKLKEGLEMEVYALVNSAGDVRNKAGHIIAGAQLPVGQFADCQKYLNEELPRLAAVFGNTTLVAIFINADLSKPQLARIAKMATAGMARAITPAFTPYDGDIIFSVSIGSKIALAEVVLGSIAAELTQQAIINAVSVTS
jgi:L-aminopeptidase/D-esterase-like protein